MIVCVGSMTPSLHASSLITKFLRFVHTMVYLPHLVPMIFHNYFTLSTSVHNNSTRHKLYLSHVSSHPGVGY